MNTYASHLDALVSVKHGCNTNRFVQLSFQVLLETFSWRKLSVYFDLNCLQYIVFISIVKTSRLAWMRVY